VRFCLDHLTVPQRRRLEEDRRCFALFSAALPDQPPLAFIELAFTRGICGDVTALLDSNSPVMDPATCDCAMFYSISSCHDGLRGIPFGNMLIRLVVERLQQELPWLTTFATVSPVPGFRPWVTELAQRRGGSLLEAVAALDAGHWTLDPDESRRLEETLVPLCAAYLLYAKRGTEPLDPVARFHLGNGARLERINWLGDRSDAGFMRSAGIVANYLYDLSSVDANRDAYSATRSLSVAPAVESLTHLNP
jgi:malonyl-CoA decarboxylase